LNIDLNIELWGGLNLHKEIRVVHSPSIFSKDIFSKKSLEYNKKLKSETILSPIFSSFNVCIKKFREGGNHFCIIINVWHELKDFFSNTVLISDKLSSFFLTKNIAKKPFKILKECICWRKWNSQAEEEQLLCIFFVLPKNYGNESQPTKHKKIKYPHFSWKKKYCQMDLVNFLQHFSLRKIETFFSNKGIMVEKILHAIAVFEPNLLEPIGVRVQAD